MVDPPIHASNHSGESLALAWQTTVPGKRLSPQREALVPAGAINERIDPGLFWIVRPGFDELLIDNVVFVSILDGKDGFVEQVAVPVLAFASLGDISKLGLSVEIDADGCLSATPMLDE